MKFSYLFIPICLVIIVLGGCVKEEEKTVEQDDVSSLDSKIMRMEKDRAWQSAIKLIDISEKSKADKYDKMEDYMFFSYDYNDDEYKEFENITLSDVKNQRYLNIDFTDDVDVMHRLLKSYITFDNSKDKKTQNISFNYFMYLKLTYLRDTKLSDSKELALVTKDLSIQQIP